MDAYVCKPVEPQILYETIHSLVKNTTTHAQEPMGKSAVAAVTADRHAQVAMPANLPVSPINLEPLLRRCRGKTKLIETLFAMFEETAGDQLEVLRSGLDRLDGAAIAEAAHTLKGMSANMSADRVSVAAAELEQLGASGDWKAATQSLQRLETSIRECLDYLPTAASSVKKRFEDASV